MRITTLVTLIATLSIGMPAMAAKYTTIDVSDGGTISGQVRFTGTDPDPQVYKITKDNEVCGAGDHTVDFVRVNNGGLSNAVVYLKKVKAGKAFDPVRTNLHLDQQACRFLPYLGVMHDGGEFLATNSDPVTHNVHAYELIGKVKKTIINISQPDKGAEYRKTITLKRGTAMKVECDAHDYMHAFTFVAKNPYYAVVDENGRFSIDQVPPGNYRLHAWHGTLGEKKAEVTVEANGTATVDFEFK